MLVISYTGTVIKDWIFSTVYTMHNAHVKAEA